MSADLMRRAFIRSVGNYSRALSKAILIHEFRERRNAHNVSCFVEERLTMMCVHRRMARYPCGESLNRDGIDNYTTGGSLYMPRDSPYTRRDSPYTR